MTSIPQPLIYKKSSVQVGLRDSPIQNLKELGNAKIKEKIENVRSVGAESV
jgi:hypothetical protein